MQFAVGMKANGKSEHAVVDADDALIAALKVKMQRPEDEIMYVRRANKRGDVRHPARRSRRCGSRRSAYFARSLRTPLKGLGSAFTSMNLPDLSSRLVHVPVIGFLTCERAFTAPLRWLSPGVLFFAMVHLRITICRR